MKKTFFLIGTAALASVTIACSSDSGTTPVSTGDGDGDGAATGGSTSTGGSTMTGTGGSTDPGTGGSSGGPVPATFVTGGLGMSGDWSGFLWTAASMLGDGTAVGSTIMPAEFTGSEICASGTIGPNFEDWAMIGWNINQPQDPDTGMGLDPLDVDVSAHAGVAVTVQDNAGGTLRVQIQNVAGDSWCANVPAGGSGTIMWSEFNTKCWDGTGDAFTPQPIAQVMVQAPAASETMPTDFNFCVVSLGPA